MSKREKLIQKINNLEAITFEEARKILLSFGFIERAPGKGSSHITFTKSNTQAITLVRTQKPLKLYAIKLIKDAINE
ncbi:MAG: type II toxin-antitoxin system HicA family toxin [Candidatus Gastranaerophilales bacterium]|nr:type II toxin-antitoxin system HicA family toxin [Candidatus Gastranaerophilales bacterium]